ncbi:uracil phosphoribosyltransferase [Verrucomicrobiaceae bacterium N1E253]|uniref:Uracil phosphoribosyltransferase n=1 Tax=Oceaniferula marina TaxID=2748318 RepID=A0A851GHQ0_9BACT|nr:uracil phosphoribosyltransferase [Oceaniferula marina]NWK55391.1 uracil phosphoribosyltransferase [Oceaniferula marina]
MNHLIEHPVINDRLARLRQRDCPSSEFRRYVREIAQLMVPAVTATLETQTIEVTTPMTTTQGEHLSHPVILVPILRAGLGMLEGFLQLLPEASVAHIGMSRNEETLQPESYYFNAPEQLPDADVLIIDPMLATGGTAAAAISELKRHGAKRLRLACLVAAPEGIQHLNHSHPDVPIFYPALDEGLNESGYILPGLGDAGDRIFGTV